MNGIFIMACNRAMLEFILKEVPCLLMGIAAVSFN